MRKNEILRGYRSFSAVLSQGISLQVGRLRCFFLSREDAVGKLRVGFSVTRGALNAAQRNRAKRLLREAYRQNKQLLQTGSVSGKDIQIIFLQTARQTGKNTMRFSEVEQAMKTLLSELRLRL
ncbi:MAG: ribonuclease P protein component [Ignavibacteriales bacterium]|nr:ribonuclease P protein component [Ignavibacteriales bacterium]